MLGIQNNKIIHGEKVDFLLDNDIPKPDSVVEPSRNNLQTIHSYSFSMIPKKINEIQKDFYVYYSNFGFSWHGLCMYDLKFFNH